MFDNKFKELVLLNLPPMGPNILPSSSNKHGLVDGNYEGYKTLIRSPKSPKIISNYHPSYSYRYGSIEMCNALAWEEDPDCVSTRRKPNCTQKYQCRSNCAACTYVGGQRFCNWLNGDVSKNVVEGDDAAELSQSLWAAEVPDSLEEAASEMDTVGKMDMTT